MTMGRPPKPTAMKLLHGDRKDRINTKEPRPAQGDIRCPTWLSPEAKKVWRRLAPDLIAKKVLTPWDIDTFADLCEVIVLNRLALQDLTANGASCTVLDREMSDGTLIYRTTKNPAWQVAKESAAILATVGGRFGLNPSDRSRLSIASEASNAKGAERLLS